MHGLLQIGRVGGVREMLGELGGVVLQPPGVYFFQRPRHLLMPANAAGGEDLFVQGLAKERVGEAKSERSANAAALLDYCSLLSLLEGGDDLVLGEAGDLL